MSNITNGILTTYKLYYFKRQCTHTLFTRSLLTEENTFSIEEGCGNTLLYTMLGFNFKLIPIRIREYMCVIYSMLYEYYNTYYKHSTILFLLSSVLVRRQYDCSLVFINHLGYSKIAVSNQITFKNTNYF